MTVIESSIQIGINPVVTHLRVDQSEQQKCRAELRGSTATAASFILSFKVTGIAYLRWLNSFHLPYSGRISGSASARVAHSLRSVLYSCMIFWSGVALVAGWWVRLLPLTLSLFPIGSVLSDGSTACPGTNVTFCRNYTVEQL